jgi:hypothetical protein
MNAATRESIARPRRHQPLAPSRRGLRTIVAISHGEVYVRSSTCPDSGWLVRASASTPPAHAGVRIAA